MYLSDVGIGDVNFYSDVDMVNFSVYKAKELFAENEPYTRERRIDGEIVIFNIHFLTSVREAFTTECVAKMSPAEETVFFDYIKYQNETDQRDITNRDDEVMKALDEWIIAELACEAQPEVNSCFDSPTHTWIDCSA